MLLPILQPNRKPAEVPNLAYRTRQASQLIALLVATLGVVVLSGWVFNVPALTSIRPEFQSMKVNTALSLLLLGAGLWLAHDDKRQRTRRVLGLAAVAIACATLVEYAFHVGLGIDQLLCRDTGTSSFSAFPGRMAIATAICSLFLGLAVTLLGTRKAIALRHTLVAACAAFSLVTLCGYLYGVRSLYSITSFSTVAVHTAAGFLAASLSYFLARTDEGIASIAVSDSNSGLLLRRLIPAVIVAPILIGWLRVEGQRANLYNTPFGIALMVLCTIGCLTALTLLTARSIYRLESEETRARYAAIVESSGDAIIATDVNGTVTDWNKGAEHLFGYSAQEARGKHISLLSTADRSEEVQGIIKKVLNGESVKQFEAVRQRKDGTNIDVSLAISPIVDAVGRTVGISGIAHDITESKRAEETLRISEERLRLAQWAAHIGTFDVNMRTGVDIWPPETEALYGLPRGSFGRTLTAFEGLIHPDDREKVIGLTREMIRTGQPAEAEWRTVWPDGTVHWIAGRGQVLMDESGEPSRMLGVNIDVTERKRVEEVLSGMTRKLVQAQEQERARIARELHDDINQRLAMLAVELGQLEDDRSDVPSRAQQLRKEAAQISNDVQALSHELHSSKLEYLGVGAGIRSWCKEFGERQKMEVNFTADVANRIPAEIGLTLFRILQEGLHNAGKHSEVKRFDVQLWEQSNEIHLTVSDAGKGFDVEGARRGRGLGLASMEERARLVNGTISIDSKPMSGTTIHVRVPIPSEQPSQRAAG